MDKFNYAQVNDDGLVIAVSELHSEVVSENLIPIEYADLDLIGRKYIRETADFSPKPPSQSIS